MIAIIDYGVGNLFSLKSSLKQLGLEAVVTADAGTIRKADRLILPGVGAFADAMAKLEATGLVPVIRAEAEKKPLLGICLGMQMSVVEFARHVAGLEGANSSEFGDTPYPVIDIMDSQKDITEKGGTMRLGLYPCKLADNSRCAEIYSAPQNLIRERHRHRWEFNNEYRKLLEDKGLMLAGLSPDEKLVEIVELPKNVHPWFVGVQFHPEFKSRPNRAHPLFRDFIRASIEYSEFGEKE